MEAPHGWLYDSYVTKEKKNQTCLCQDWAGWQNQNPECAVKVKCLSCLSNHFSKTLYKFEWTRLLIIETRRIMLGSLYRKREINYPFFTFAHWNWVPKTYLTKELFRKSNQQKNFPFPAVLIRIMYRAFSLTWSASMQIYWNIKESIYI